MSLPRMSWHIGDYKKDTGHLRAAEHGAYFLLIMHYWATGGLPTDDRQLATIACMTDKEWNGARQTLAAFFQPNWKHKRVEEEISDANEKYKKRSAAGYAGGIATANRKQKPGNATGNATGNAAPLLPANAQQPITDNPNRKRESPSSGTAPTKGLLAGELRRQIVEIYKEKGWEPIPDTGRAEVWLAQGFQADLIIAVLLEKVGKGGVKPLTYFDNPIREAHEKSTAAGSNGRAKPIPGVDPPAPDLDEKTQHTMAKIWLSHLKNGNDSWNIQTPPPGKPGCKIKAEILRENGIDPESGKRLEPAKTST
jgi:uncharacterized protein YdaU (DUF1376 family)